LGADRFPSKNPPTPRVFKKALFPSPNGVNERTSSIEPGRVAKVPAATNPEPRAIGSPLLSRIGTAVESAELMFKNETVKPEICPQKKYKNRENSYHFI